MAHVASRGPAMSWSDINEVLALIRSLCATDPLTIETHDRGQWIAERYGLGVYDAVIAAAALIGECGVLYSEVMQEGLLNTLSSFRDPPPSSPGKCRVRRTHSPREPMGKSHRTEGRRRPHPLHRDRTVPAGRDPHFPSVRNQPCRCHGIRGCRMIVGNEANGTVPDPIAVPEESRRGADRRPPTGSAAVRRAPTTRSGKDAAAAHRPARR
jgi:hypothetical protein